MSKGRNNQHNQLYQLGEFSRRGQVSERTIRYYDEINLLKPTFIGENGYRYYSEEDLVTLNLINGLKVLDFSLEDIKDLLNEESDDEIKHSLKIQYNLLVKKISMLQSLKYVLNDIIESKSSKISNHIDEISQLNEHEFGLINHYRDEKYLKNRIAMHSKYGVNKVDWYTWLRKQFSFIGVNKILDIGCGNGAQWKGMSQQLRNRELFLSDASEGMLENARETLKSKYAYILMDCENISFQNEWFDMVTANHVLFHVRNLDRGLSEIYRVLKVDGMLYCSTYGENHMKELNQLVRDFDERIKLSNEQLYKNFGIENGKEILGKYFDEITFEYYDDSLEIDDAQIILDYIISSHGNQIQYLDGRIDEFYNYIDNLISKTGKIYVTKEVGVFKARKTM